MAEHNSDMAALEEASARLETIVAREGHIRVPLKNVSRPSQDFFVIDFRINDMYDYRTFQRKNEGRAFLMNENWVYTVKHTVHRSLCMSKKINEEFISFGKRLAKLRKAAGYTQQQLADEIGATRRMIAYYESESQHPPANRLADLARALNVSADALLGIKPVETTPISNRLERRIRQIEKLGPKPRQQITQLIDTFVEAEQLKQKANAS